MKNLTSYLFVMFMGMFWVFRIIVAFCYNIGVDFVTVPYDLSYEIVLLFLTLIAMTLVIKRMMIGGVIYLIGYGLYFGTILFSLLPSIINGTGIQNYIDLIIALLGIILPLLVFFDLLLDRNRREHPVDKKTDWFYKNEEYDRKFDERADRNEYKF